MKQRYRPKKKFLLTERDINIIDDVIIDQTSNKNNLLSKDFLFKHVKENNIELSFKTCGLRTFYKVRDRFYRNNMSKHGSGINKN